jgi:chromosome segregation ATPase
MERKEPTFSGSSSTPSNPTAEPNFRSKPDSFDAQSPPRARPKASEPTPNTASPMTGFALFLVVVSLAFSGYIYVQLQDTQALLVQASGKIHGLEQQLSLSDDESTQSVTALQGVIKKQQASLKDTDLEVRKLWDTRNVNKNAIAANQKLIKTAQASVNKLNPVVADVVKLKQTVSSQAAKTSDLLSKINANAKTLASFSADFERQKTVIEQQKITLRELFDSNRKSENDLLDIKGKFKATEEAIESIDAFRKNTNSQLWKLKQSMANSAAPVSTSSQ